MDTDDLSDKAYEIIVHAARVCDTLKTELGALSYECENEDIWLEKVQTRLNEIAKIRLSMWNTGTWRRKKVKSGRPFKGGQ